MPNTIIAIENNIQTDMSPIYNTNASESLKSQLSDVLEFLADCHTLSKIKVRARTHCMRVCIVVLFFEEFSLSLEL